MELPRALCARVVPAASLFGCLLGGGGPEPSARPGGVRSYAKRQIRKESLHEKIWVDRGHLSSLVAAAAFVPCFACLSSLLWHMLPNRFSPKRFFCVLLLALYLEVCMAVTCTSCYDDPSNGAAHTTENCPWITGIAANVAALAGTATALSLNKLLPTRVIFSSTC